MPTGDTIKKRTGTQQKLFEHGVKCKRWLNNNGFSPTVFSDHYFEIDNSEFAEIEFESHFDECKVIWKCHFSFVEQWYCDAIEVTDESEKMDPKTGTAMVYVNRQSHSLPENLPSREYQSKKWENHEVAQVLREIATTQGSSDSQER